MAEERDDLYREVADTVLDVDDADPRHLADRVLASYAS
jgi:shikimate kinase